MHSGGECYRRADQHHRWEALVNWVTGSYAGYVKIVATLMLFAVARYFTHSDW